MPNIIDILLYKALALYAVGDLFHYENRILYANQPCMKAVLYVLVN